MVAPDPCSRLLLDNANTPSAVVAEDFDGHTPMMQQYLHKIS